MYMYVAVCVEEVCSCELKLSRRVPRGFPPHKAVRKLFT